MTTKNVASTYHTAPRTNIVTTGYGTVVHWRTATSTTSRNVIMRKRTRPNNGSHSLTLGVDSISQSPKSLPPARFLWWREGSPPLSFACNWTETEPGLVSSQFADQ